METFQTPKPMCFKRWLRRGYAIFRSLHRHVTIGVLTCGMSILLLPSKAAADKIDSVTIRRVTDIDEVAIVGTPVAPTRSTMTLTPLFDRVSAAAAPLQTLESALRLAPAIDLRERGGRGVQADISIRGGSPDQTMLLLNGINFTDARTGHQTHSIPIDIDCVAGIDLVDGLTGVGAYAGAIDIRTRPLLGNYLRTDLAAGGDGYFYGNLSGALTHKRLVLFTAHSYRRSDGYRPNTDFGNWNTFTRLNYDSRWGFFDLQGGYQSRKFGSNGFYAAWKPDQYEETRTGLVSLRWVKRWERLTLHASAGYRKNFDRYDWTRGSEAGRNRHRTDNLALELWSDLRTRIGVTSLGGDYTSNRIYSTNLGDKLPTPHGRYTHGKSRRTGNLWLRHVKTLGRFDAAGSVGVSRSPYGTSMLWSLQAGYRPADALRVELAAAQSMRLPTFTDLYYTSAAQLNNPDLAPERAVTYRLSTDFARGPWSAALRTFYRDGRNVIDWVWRPDLENRWRPEQTARMSTVGIELTGRWQRESGFLRSVSVSYCWVDSDLRTDLQTRNAMDYLRHKAVLSLTAAPHRRLLATLTGSVYDRNGSYTHYPTAGTAEGGVARSFVPYFLLDARVSWSKGPVRLYIDATNLTDTSYCDMGGLPLPGLWLGGGLTLTIGR